eukprot:GHVQ01000592.1.p1 GENE.GHVQ01000592.1~~GHVQ01000592.1.p1  ORF type:complete len:225 (-),score=29.48 GHVQ01000592.1:152-826(-)
MKSCATHTRNVGVLNTHTHTHTEKHTYSHTHTHTPIMHGCVRGRGGGGAIQNGDHSACMEQEWKRSRLTSQRHATTHMRTTHTLTDIHRLIVTGPHACMHTHYTYTLYTYTETHVQTSTHLEKQTRKQTHMCIYTRTHIYTCIYPNTSHWESFLWKKQADMDVRTLVLHYHHHIHRRPVAYIQTIEKTSMHISTWVDAFTTTHICGPRHTRIKGKKNQTISTSA